MSVSLVNALPLQNVSNAFSFVGDYDNIVNFCEIDVAINAEGDYSVTFDFSPDKIQTITSNTETFTYSSSSFITYKLMPECKYFRLSFLATSNISNVMVQTIYKSNLTYSLLSGGGGGNVNIVSQSAGLALDSSLTTINNTLNTLGAFVLFNNSVIGAGDVSNALDNGSCSRVLSLFGNTSSSTTLTIQFALSIPVSTSWFSSQYSITANGNWGFSFPCSFQRMRIISSDATTISAYCVFA
jgi:hypothetical protein